MSVKASNSNMNYFTIAWILCTPAVFIYWIPQRSTYVLETDPQFIKWYKRHQNSVLATMVWWAVYFAFAGLYTAIAS